MSKSGAPVPQIKFFTLVTLAVASTISPPILAQTEEPTASRSYAKQLSTAFRHAASEALPSVVTIQTIAEPRGSSAPLSDQSPKENPFRGTPFEDFFRERDDLWRFFEELPSQPRRQFGMGSGVIIDPSGIILTNNHVVERPGKIIVRLSDDREFDATKVETDPKTDLAVVWIEGAGKLKAAKLGDSDQLEIGDWVLAVGHPFGLFESVTAGIISAKGRGLQVAQREEFLQTDAAINPGNSGGPLINLDGEVVGINTAISSRTGGYQGAGFAIPINLAKWVTEQLVGTGKVRRAYLGVGIERVSHELAQEFGVQVGSGALVTQVWEDSPAREAGLQSGDIIQEFSGKAISDPRDLQAAVEQSKIGSQQPMTIVREGKRRILPVTVRLQPNYFGKSLRHRLHQEEQETEKNYVTSEKLGIKVKPITPELARQLGLEEAEGVVIQSVSRDSQAEEARLTPGMVITEVNRQPIRSLEDFRKAVENPSTNVDRVLLLVSTAQGNRFVVIRTK